MKAGQSNRGELERYVRRFARDWTQFLKASPDVYMRVGYGEQALRQMVIRVLGIAEASRLLGPDDADVPPQPGPIACVKCTSITGPFVRTMTEGAMQYLCEDCEFIATRLKLAGEQAIDVVYQEVNH